MLVAGTLRLLKNSVFVHIFRNPIHAPYTAVFTGDRLAGGGAGAGPVAADGAGPDHGE
jgi:hypothetical protein